MTMRQQMRLKQSRWEERWENERKEEVRRKKTTELKWEEILDKMRKEEKRKDEIRWNWETRRQNETKWKDKRKDNAKGKETEGEKTRWEEMRQDKKRKLEMRVKMRMKRDRMKTDEMRGDKTRRLNHSKWEDRWDKMRGETKKWREQTRRKDTNEILNKMRKGRDKMRQDNTRQKKQMCGGKRESERKRK